MLVSIMIETDDTDMNGGAIFQLHRLGITQRENLIGHSALAIHINLGPRAIVQFHLREIRNTVNPAIGGNFATGANRGLLHGGNDFLLVIDRPFHAVKLSCKLGKYILIHVKISFSIFKHRVIIKLSIYACRFSVCYTGSGFSFSAWGKRLRPVCRTHRNRPRLRSCGLSRCRGITYPVPQPRLFHRARRTRETPKLRKTFSFCYLLPCVIFAGSLSVPVLKLFPVPFIGEILPDSLNQQQACGSGLSLHLWYKHAHGSLHGPMRS